MQNPKEGRRIARDEWQQPEAPGSVLAVTGCSRDTVAEDTTIDSALCAKSEGGRGWGMTTIAHSAPAASAEA